MHKLSLEISRKTPCNILHILDTSYYDPNFPVENAILEINPPTKECFSIFELDFPWCSKSIDCTDLDVCCPNNNDVALPDGNYEIKYSIDPNLSTMVEFNYFRVCVIMSQLVNKICWFLSNRCSLSLIEQKEMIEHLSEIKRLIDFAVFAAEECLDVSEARRLYDEAKEKLNKDDSCPTCK